MFFYLTRKEMLYITEFLLGLKIIAHFFSANYKKISHYRSILQVMLSKQNTSVN